MLFDVSLLTTQELLFLSESLYFSQGIKSGLTFLELKEIRIKLRDISEELKKRTGRLKRQI